MKRYLVLLGCLIGCAHSDPFVTNDIIQPPIDPPTPRLTFNVFRDSSQVWTPDGTGILYTYGDSGVEGDHQCLAILDRAGGTRRWSYCDTRSIHADSVERFSAPALRADGKLLFLQGIYKRPSPRLPVGPVVKAVLWLGDTSNLNATRQIIISFPQLVDDSVISWLTDAEWIDQNTFIAASQRYSNDGNGHDVPELRSLITGTVGPNGVTLHKIAGTENVLSWARAGNGDLIYQKGNWWTLFVSGGVVQALTSDSMIWRIPATGGTPIAIARAPKRLGSLSCTGNDCIAADKEFVCGSNCVVGPGYRAVCGACAFETHGVYYLDLVTNTFRLLLDTGPAASARHGPRLSPNGTEYSYRVQNDLYLSPFARP